VNKDLLKQRLAKFSLNNSAERVKTLLRRPRYHEIKKSFRPVALRPHLSTGLPFTSEQGAKNTLSTQEEPKAG